MEEVVGVTEALTGYDVVVVEGLAPSTEHVWSTRVDAAMANALDADVLLVADGDGGPVDSGSGDRMADAVAIAASTYRTGERSRVAGCVVNRVADGSSAATAELTATLARHGVALAGAVPFRAEFTRPRMRDVVREVGARTLVAGRVPPPPRRDGTARRRPDRAGRRSRTAHRGCRDPLCRARHPPFCPARYLRRGLGDPARAGGVPSRRRRDPRSGARRRPVRRAARRAARKLGHDARDGAGAARRPDHRRHDDARGREVDGLVAGAVHTTASTVRPAFELIRAAPGARLVSSVFFMCLPEEAVVYGDCAINPDPDAADLADIAPR
jgi:hypothetical protein